jgi:hypothetical protein
MQKLHFSIHINAPKEKVWNTMLDNKTYREWTSVFSPGSDFVGNWDKGSKILFVGPNNNGKTSGMVSRIAENRPYEFLSIEHLGVVNDGVEDTTSEAVKGWVGALENYTFREVDGVTEVIVDMDSTDELSDEFNKMWPKGLQKLKELAEQ